MNIQKSMLNNKIHLSHLANKQITQNRNNSPENDMKLIENTIDGQHNSDELFIPNHE